MIFSQGKWYVTWISIHENVHTKKNRRFRFTATWIWIVHFPSCDMEMYIEKLDDLDSHLNRSFSFVCLFMDGELCNLPNLFLSSKPVRNEASTSLSAHRNATCQQTDDARRKLEKIRPRMQEDDDDWEIVCPMICDLIFPIIDQTKTTWPAKHHYENSLDGLAAPITGFADNLISTVHFEKCIDRVSYMDFFFFFWEFLVGIFK